MYENIKKWFKLKLWSAKMVKDAVAKGILTEAQGKEIVGE